MTMTRFAVMAWMTGLALQLIDVAAPVTAVAAEQALGAARLQTVEKSGVQARILFLDSGSADTGLVVSGEATGLDPQASYFTLVYDRGARARGPEACRPAGDPPLTGDQMGVGFWEVGPDGAGTLFAIKTGGTYVSLEDIGAVSVRIVLGPPPEGFELEACGRVLHMP